MFKKSKIKIKVGYGKLYSLSVNITGQIDRKIFGVRNREYNYLFNKLEFKKKNNVLDFGCNNGWFINHIKLKFPKIDAFGYDINEFAISKAKQKYNKIKFINKIPPGKKFDFIFLLHVLEHINNPKSIIKEASKLLNKNGRLIIVVPQERIRGDTTPIQIFANILSLNFENPHVNKINLKFCELVMKRYGLKITDYTYNNLIPKFYSKDKKFHTYSLVMIGQKI